MKRGATTLDDLAQAIADLGTIVGAQITELRNDIGGLNDRVGGLEGEVGGLKFQVSGMRQDIRALQIGQRDHSHRLSNLENGMQAVHSDIKELYSLVAN